MHLNFYGRCKSYEVVKYLRLLICVGICSVVTSLLVWDLSGEYLPLKAWSAPMESGRVPLVFCAAQGAQLCEEEHCEGGRG